MEKEMIQKIKSPTKGQSLLEFALMLPILLLIVIGVIEFGRIFLLYTEASNAAREAARYGVAAGQSPNNMPRYLDCAEIRQAAPDPQRLYRTPRLSRPANQSEGAPSL